MSNYGNRPPDYYSIYKLPQTELIKLVQLDEYENVIYIVTSDKYAENYIKSKGIEDCHWLLLLPFVSSPKLYID